jgi:hypothetical protein
MRGSPAMRRFFFTKRHSIQVKLRVVFIKQITDKVNTFRSSHGVIGSEIQIERACHKSTITPFNRPQLLCDTRNRNMHNIIQQDVFIDTLR